MNKLKSPFKALSIDKLLETVRRSAERVKQSAEGVKDDYAVATLQTTQRIEGIAQATEKGVVGLNDLYQEMDTNVRELTHQQQYIWEQLKNGIATLNGTFELLKDEVLSKSPDIPRDDP